MGRKVFGSEVLTSSDINTLLMDQAVMVFASASARSAAIPQPTLGMHTHLTSTGQTQRWNGLAWRDLAIAKVSTSDAVAGQVVGDYRDHPTYGLQRWNGSRWSSLGGGQWAATPAATVIQPGGTLGVAVLPGGRAAAIGMPVLVDVRTLVVFANGAAQQTLQATLHASSTGFTVTESEFDAVDRIPGGSGSGAHHYLFSRKIVLTPTSLDYLLAVQFQLGTGATTCQINNPRAFVHNAFSLGTP
jgi:hypothetical protein